MQRTHHRPNLHRVPSQLVNGTPDPGLGEFGGVLFPEPREPWLWDNPVVDFGDPRESRHVIGGPAPLNQKRA